MSEERWDPHPCRALRPFTLIELLVVIAIISILASMLLPALSRARDLAKKAVCIDNEKQITLASFLYVDDNDGWPPLAGISGCGGAFGCRHGLEWWLETLTPYLGLPRAQTTIPPVYENYGWWEGSVYECPADTDASVHPRHGGTDFPAWSSYGMNEYGTWEYPVGVYGGNKLDTWREPEGHLLFVDSNGRGMREEAEIVALIANRHSDGYNVAYADGHVGWVRGPGAAVDQVVGVKWSWWYSTSRICY